MLINILMKYLRICQNNLEIYQKIAQNFYFRKKRLVAVKLNQFIQNLLKSLELNQALPILKTKVKVNIHHKGKIKN